MIEKRAIRRDPVKSSNIRSIGYSGLRRKLEVEFNSGDVYRYRHVPGRVYKAFKLAPSKGKFLNAEIKYKFPYRKYEGSNGEKVHMNWKKLPKKLPKKPAEDVLDKAAALNSDIKLYPHQQRIIDNPATSMVIAHGVGSGKTLTSIAKFEHMKNQGKASKALVVVPAGLRHNYANDGVKKFTNSSVNVIGNSQERHNGLAGEASANHDYNVVSYDMFRRNPEDYIKNTGADTLIFDEAHRTKNESTATAAAVRAARPLYKNHIGLTGSLISNSVSDLQPLVDAATNGDHSLGKTKDEFEANWVVRDPAKKYRNANPKRVPIKAFRNAKALGHELNRVIDYMGADESRSVANIPNKKINVVKVPLSHDQAKAYRKLLNGDKKVKQLIKMKRLETLKNDEAAAAFNRLTEGRKLMNDISTVHPGMDLATAATKSPKTKRMLDDLENHLRTTPDGQAIVLSNLVRGGADVVDAGLKARKINAGRFLGKGVDDVTEESRQADVDAFKKRKKRAIIISPAGGEGVSLNNTTWEGVLDPHFNPERMNQMEARGIRAGGLKGRPDRTVEVNRYLSTMPKTFGIFKSNLKTPDEFIYEIAQNKEQQNKKLYDLIEKYK